MVWGATPAVVMMLDSAPAKLAPTASFATSLSPISLSLSNLSLSLQPLSLSLQSLSPICLSFIDLSLLQANVEGLKCSSCVPGSFFLASGGCTLCNCSRRSGSCQQNPNVTSEPSEVCDCPAPYEGGSCDQCQSGWFMSAETGNCQQCRCNGLADVCLDGNGTCLVGKGLNQKNLA